MPQIETATAIDYAAIRAQLTPRQRVLTWDAHRELLHPHDAPDDADWPAPKNYSEARNLLDRLSHRAQVLCAYIAAEMVLPIWEQWADGREDVDAGAPRRALELVRHWLDGEPVSRRELRDAAYAADAADAAYTAADAYTAAYAAYAAAYAAYAAYAAAYAARAAAVADAARAVADARQEFYTRWWARCRARLAIANIETAELEAA